MPRITSHEASQKFFQSLSEAEWQHFFDNNGTLNAELTARLWRLAEYQGPPPDSLQAFFSRDDIKRIWPSKKKCRHGVAKRR